MPILRRGRHCGSLARRSQATVGAAALVVAAVAICASTASAAGPSSSCDDDGGSGSCPFGEEAAYFPGVPHITFKGPGSYDPFSYRYYNADELVLGKPMKEWLRFSVAFWHTFRGDGADPFGSPTKAWPWADPNQSEMERAEAAMRANFELLKKLGVNLWCFHDRDIAPEGKTLTETNANLDKMAALAEELQQGTDIHVLWGTAQLFKHPRFMNGAATSPQAEVFAFAAAQVKKAMEVTQRLGGENYVFWGGREGYQTLLNTDLEKEQGNFAKFLRMAADYNEKIGFNAQLLIEPKPQEPTKHQYDWDVATTLSFLRKHSLDPHFKINVECNHATLAGHSCHHEVETARVEGMLGNIDANTGDAQTGWDTDEFLTDVKEATLLMHTVVKNGGLAPGGFNFDAKLRRESIDLEDIVLAHVSGIDALARGLRNAAALVSDGALDTLVKERYASYDTGLGAEIASGTTDFEKLERVALDMSNAGTEPIARSAKQEFAERLLSHHLD